MGVTSRSDLYTWFSRLKKPTAAQFRAWIDSFWHKSEKIPITSIDGIDDLIIQKADADLLNLHIGDDTRHLTDDQIGEIDKVKDKADTVDLATVATTGGYYDLNNRPLKLSDFENDLVFEKDGNLHVVRRSEDKKDNFQLSPPLSSDLEEDAIKGDTAIVIYTVSKYKSFWSFNGATWFYNYSLDLDGKENLSEFKDDVGYTKLGFEKSTLNMTYVMSLIDSNRTISNFSIGNGITARLFKYLPVVNSFIEGVSDVKSSDADISIIDGSIPVKYVFFKKSFFNNSTSTLSRKLNCFSDNKSKYRVVLYKPLGTRDHFGYDELPIQIDFFTNTLIYDDDYFIYEVYSNQLNSGNYTFEDFNVGELYLADLKNHLSDFDNDVGFVKGSIVETFSVHGLKLQCFQGMTTKSTNNLNVWYHTGQVNKDVQTTHLTYFGDTAHSLYVAISSEEPVDSIITMKLYSQKSGQSETLLTETFITMNSSNGYREISLTNVNEIVTPDTYFYLTFESTATDFHTDYLIEKLILNIQ